MGTKITVTISADTSRLDRAFQELAERVKSGDSELTDVDGEKRALKEVIPSKLFPCHALDGYAAQIAELAHRHERERVEKLWREHIANLDTDPQ